MGIVGCWHKEPHYLHPDCLELGGVFSPTCQACVPVGLHLDDLLIEEEIKTALNFEQDIKREICPQCIEHLLQAQRSKSQAFYQQKIKEIGELLCNYIGNRMLEDKEVGLRLGNDLNPLLKHL